MCDSVLYNMCGLIEHIRGIRRAFCHFYYVNVI